MSDEMALAIEAMKQDIGTLKADVSVLKTDVSVLKTDVSVLTTDVSVLKTDVSVLKTDVSVLKTDVSALRVTTTNIAVSQSRLVGQVNGLETRLDEKMSKGFGDVLSKLDSFAGEVKSSRDQRTLQDRSFNLLNDRLADHELRLTRLEPPKKKS